MKKKKLNSKLSFGKQTVSNLRASKLFGGNGNNNTFDLYGCPGWTLNCATGIIECESFAFPCEFTQPEGCCDF